MDGDGRLDVMVMAPAANMDGNPEYVIYMYDPMNNPAQPKAAMYMYSDGDYGTYSFPFVGDINGLEDGWDGKKLPEFA